MASNCVLSAMTGAKYCLKDNSGKKGEGMPVGVYDVCGMSLHSINEQK